MYWVYVLENANGRFYIGHSDDLSRRLSQHNDSSNSKTKYGVKHGPWKVVWTEEYRDRASAMLRERQIKCMKSARWIREILLAGAS